MTWIWNAGGNDGFGDVRNILKSDGNRHGILFLPLKALLVKAGWTVEGSGDGASLHEFRGATGGAGTGSGGAFDVWTADTGVHDASPGNVSNALAWCVLKAPTGTLQYLLVGTASTTTSFDAYGTIMFSDADGYVAAGISPTIPPATVTDEQPLTSSSRAFGNGDNLINFSGDQYIHMGANNAAVSGIYGFWWATVSTAGGRFNMQQLAPISAKRSWDVAPYLWISASGGETGRTWEKKDLTGETWVNNAGWPALMLFDNQFWRGLGNPDPETGDLPMGEPQILARRGIAIQEHFRGVLPDVRMRAATTDGAPVPADYPSFTERDPDGLVWVHWFNIAFPWDDTASPPTPLGGVGGVTAVEWFRMADLAPPAAPGDTTSPVISALSPPAGTDIEPDQVVSFDVTDDVGAFTRIFVVAKDLDSGIAEMVHDGDAFNGFFIEQSTRTLITGGIHYEILRRGGWTGTRLEISAFAIDVSGNEGTL